MTQYVICLLTNLTILDRKEYLGGKIIFEKIQEEYGKLKGTIIKSIDENKKNKLIYVCSDCQKKDNWIDNAKIKGA